MPKFPISTPHQFTAYVRALRKARGLTQSDVAKMLGVSKMRVATIEKDVGRVSTASILALIHLLGGTLHLEAPELDGGVTDPPPANNVKSKAGTVADAPRRGEW